MITSETHELTSSVETIDVEISAETLLQSAHDRGYSFVTERKLERWHREEDCLPHPRQTHASGMRGSRTMYPAAAVNQLDTLCQLIAANGEKRVNFDALRLALWLRGYPVPVERLRASLRTLAFPSPRALFQRGTMRFRDRLEAAEHVARALFPHFRRGAMGKLIRTRLPEIEDQMSLLTMQIQLLLGDTPAFDSIEEYLNGEGGRDKSLPELMRDALALGRAQTDATWEAEPWLPVNLVSTLVSFAKHGLLSWHRARRAVLKATESDLTRARVDREVLFVLFPAVVAGMEAVFGENILGFGWVRELPTLMPPADMNASAVQLVCLLVIREAGYGDQVDQVEAAIRKGAPVWEKAPALLDALRREVPGATELLTLDVQVLRTREAFEQHLAKIRGFRERNLADIDAFWARHPDLYALGGG